MKARVNQRLFSARVFDSGSLGVLISVMHQFHQPGEYSVSIRQHGREVGTTTFRVEEAATASQLDIDLSLVGRPQRDECGCKSKQEKVPTVSPKGYVLFFATGGAGGYSAVVRHPEARQAAFQTERLEKGDLCAVSLLRPGRYRMVDKASGAQGAIELFFSPDGARKLQEMQPVFVEAAGREFQPAQVRVMAGQGLVFRVAESSRIIIELEKAADQEPEPERPERPGRPGRPGRPNLPRRPVIRWTRPDR
ncbi:MAG: hypothetical protein ACOY94_10360 [Bacillota bacterium]